MNGSKILLWILLILAGLSLTLSSGCEDDQDDDIGQVPDTTQNGDTNFIPAGWKMVGDLNANNMIWSLASDDAGNIYAAGYFTNPQGYCYVARWNGTTWSELGHLNANAGISSITATPAGDVYATGMFSNGATPSGGEQYVAHWDGIQWTDIGGGGSTWISSDGAGNVYKSFTKWNGSAWQQLCPLCVPMGGVYSIISNDAGTVQYAGGTFAYPSGYRYVARCDDSNCWAEIGQLNANADIQALTTDPEGNVYAAGSFTNGNLPTTGYCYVAKWDGTDWSDLGSLNANQSIYSLAYDRVNGYLYASGYFSNSQGKSYVAKWDGTSWKDLGDMRLSPTPIMVDGSGKLYSVVTSGDGVRYTVVVHD